MVGEDLITMAGGIREPFNNGVSEGFSYERVLIQREDIFEQRAPWMLAYDFEPRGAKGARKILNDGFDRPARVNARGSFALRVAQAS